MKLKIRICVMTLAAVIAAMPGLTVSAQSAKPDESALREKYADLLVRAAADGSPLLIDAEPELYYPPEGPFPTWVIYNEHCERRVTVLEYRYPGAVQSGAFFYAPNSDGTAVIVGADRAALAAEQTQTLNIPAELDGYTVTEIGAGAFEAIGESVPTLWEITLPDTVTVIRNNAFYKAFDRRTGCRLQLPQEPAYLGHLCFGALLDALGDTVTLPETLEFADYCAFGGDTYLQSLTLPESPVVCATGLMLYSTGQRNEFGMPDESRAYFANAIMNPVAGAALADDGSLEELQRNYRAV